MDPKAIIAALPWLRRIWRVMPAPMRVPVLLLGAAIGVVQFVLGRRSAATRDTVHGAGPVADPRSPAGTEARADD